MSDRDISDCLTRWFDMHQRDLPETRSLLVAVSGGSDSLALLCALSEIASERGLDLAAATVDHGLRAEARDEAQMVSRVCTQLGVPHDILSLNWADPSAVTQEAARGARYRALAGHARKVSARVIATGHTHNDQLETVYMRLRAGSDAWGLSGMSDIAPVPVWPEGMGLRLIRPLMRADREDLRTYLHARQVEWVDDPSNEKLVFERVRVRKLLSERTQLAGQLADTQRLAAARRLKISQALAEWAGQALSWHAGGAVTFSAADWLSRTLEERLVLLKALLPSIAGKFRAPRNSILEAVLELEGLERGRTLGGCYMKRTADKVLIAAEPIPESDQSIVFAGNTMVWNGRIGFELPEGTGRTLKLAQWGKRGVPAELTGSDLPDYDVRRSLPVLLTGEEHAFRIPHLEKCADLKVYDLAPERFLSLLSFSTDFFAKEIGRRESFS